VTANFVNPNVALGPYRIRDAQRVLTPALLVYPDLVDANVRATLRLLEGNASRWRPHVKTVKLEFIMRRLVESGVMQFKCATTLELATACRAGARDVLFAYPAQGANTARVLEIAREFPDVRVSALIDAESAVPQWKGGPVSLFVDVNSGMDRTGADPLRTDDVLRLVRAIRAAGLEFRGLHFYDGHLGDLALADRTVVAHRGYDHLMALVAALEEAGETVSEIITAGTPALPCSLSYMGFAAANFVHRVSPGTLVYGDATSLAQLPAEYGYKPAVLVLARVVSHPTPNLITCDAGHKAVSADAGVPTCAVLGRPDLLPRGPSEEHLPIEVSAGAPRPGAGEFLYLLPRHVCPTVNNFNEALIVRDGRVEQVERVTARGHEAPLPAAVTA
jgi:D-serine deaminase-like pyridoxal phosphate-dependent protein